MEEEWDITGLEQHLESDFNLKLPVKQWLEQDHTLDEERYVNVFEQNLKRLLCKKKKK